MLLRVFYIPILYNTVYKLYLKYSFSGFDPPTAGSTLDGTVIPACGGLFTKGTRLMFEPIQWLPNGANGVGQVAANRAGTKQNHVAFVRGARAFYGHLKFKPSLTHVSNPAVNNVNASPADISLAQRVSSGFPLLLRY